MDHHLIIACVALAVASPPSFADQPIIINFSHVTATDTPKGMAAEFFKKAAEERTKGRVRVNVWASWMAEKIPRRTSTPRNSMKCEST